ncbi:MAG: type II and III secretion system protein family protein, partial [Hyphomicrobiales bacterium]|nr:type II and III secretion system protein family protein [Hyphomicrobiales bacterium]
DFAKRETELVIMVTPYTVKAVNPQKLADPGKNLEPAADSQTALLSRLNRIYGVGGASATGSYYGRYGFIIE